MHSPDSGWPRAGLAVAVVAVSTSAILVRWSEAPAVTAAFYRVLFTTLLLAPVALGRYRQALRSLSQRDLLVAVAAGGTLAVHFAAWFESLRWTSVAASVTLVQAQPVFVAVGAWALLGERLSARQAVGMVLALGGMAVMSVGGLLARGVLAGSRPLYGDGLAVLGAAAASGYVLAGRSLRQRVPLVPYVTVVYAACTVGLGVLAVGRGSALGGYPPREWWLFLAMALGPGILGHTLVNWALGHLESNVVSVSLLGEPVGATFLALVLLGEIPDAVTLVGGAVVLVGIVVTTTRR